MLSFYYLPLTRNADEKLNWQNVNQVVHINRFLFGSALNTFLLMVTSVLEIIWFLDHMFNADITSDKNVYDLNKYFCHSYIPECIDIGKKAIFSFPQLV